MADIAELEAQFKPYYEEAAKATWDFSQMFGEEDSDSDSDSDSDGGMKTDYDCHKQIFFFGGR